MRVLSRSRLYHGHSPGGKPTPDGSAGTEPTVSYLHAELECGPSQINPPLTLPL